MWGVGPMLESHCLPLRLVPTDRFPRSRKFLLGDRIGTTAPGMLEPLIEASHPAAGAAISPAPTRASKSRASSSAWCTTRRGRRVGAFASHGFRKAGACGPIRGGRGFGAARRRHSSVSYCCRTGVGACRRRTCAASATGFGGPSAPESVPPNVDAPRDRLKGADRSAASGHWAEAAAGRRAMPWNPPGPPSRRSVRTGRTVAHSPPFPGSPVPAEVPHARSAHRLDCA